MSYRRRSEGCQRDIDEMQATTDTAQREPVIAGERGIACDSETESQHDCRPRELAKMSDDLAKMDTREFTMQDPERNQEQSKCDARPN